MKRSIIQAAIISLACCLMATGSLAQPAVPDQTPAGPRGVHAIASAIPDIETRLVTLTPTDPEKYFLLGEEIADIAVEEHEREVARRLFLIAYTRWRSAGDDRNAAAACLALTTVVSSERDRAWLRAIAASIDPRRARVDWDPSSWTESDPEASLMAAQALGSVRAGDGISARQLLSDPRVLRALSRYDSLLQSAGGLSRLHRDAAVWPCPDCRNRRLVSSRGTQEFRDIVCGHCRGDPGPRLRTDEIIAHLRVESLLLAGDATVWSAQLEIDGGAPLRDPNPDLVPSAFGIDTSLVLYRDGAWVHERVAPSSPSDPTSAPGD
ncbi:MAG: hypothetical protein KF912_14195 [Phycisphaeraceae bacterium]|nr:hypothetical protein [Phycisphaeraceae bacterium]